MPVPLSPRFLLLLLASAATFASDTTDRNHYMLHCQGCHTPDGRGAEGKVPNLNGFMGYFLSVEGGREFLIQVPGAAQSALSDEALAAVTNWMLVNFSRWQLPAQFRPYSAAEVGALRKEVPLNVADTRRALVEGMREKGLVIED
ncbi:MAG: c-type cytochrome [Parahaliea sp.]